MFASMHQRFTKRIFFIALSMLFAVNTIAEEYLLTGTIGKYPVVAKIWRNEGNVNATYFYSSACKDIKLDGIETKSGVALFMTFPNYKTNKTDTTEQWLLKQNTDKSWKGTWANNKGRKYEVALKPINIKAIKNQYDYLPVVKKFKKDDAYEYARSSMITIVKDTAIIKNGKYALQYHHVKNTKIKICTITGGLEKQVADKVNLKLMNTFIETACNALGCEGYGAGNEDPYDYSISSIFLTDNILSIDIATGWDCAGQAHPEEGDDFINMDMKTGEELQLDDVLHLTNSVAPKPQTKEWYDYNDTQYAPKLVALLKRLYPKQMTDTGDCNYVEESVWQYAGWHFTDQGLYMSPSFPHVTLECRGTDWSYIPYDILKKYKNPKKKIALP